MGTNNIFAQFSSSLDSYGNFIDYPVVSGSVFNEQYNETLDSATIVLSQIPKEKRLSYIKQYDFVRVYDKSGNTGLDNVYLLDSFTETENNINEHIFGYTINLMSQTKLLEKIQCPNLVVTHKVNKNGTIIKKTIYQKIKEYMELYVPKVKMYHENNGAGYWIYEPLIKMASGNEHNENGTFNGINEDYFVAQGDDYEVVIRKNISEFTDIDINSIDSESVQTSNVVSDGNIPFYELEVWFDTNTNDFVFDGIVRLIEPDSSWHANISFDFSFEANPFFARFNVSCADLPFNAPTLRQLLTTLMMQVGCIPVVKNRVLGYLDFQLEAKNFNNGEYTVGKTVNRITRGASSDSYVNTLVNMSSQVMDSGNEVICETLGFRDRSNAILRQKSNLYLETSLPIYKVNKCILHAPGKYSGFLSGNYGCSIAGFDLHIFYAEPPFRHPFFLYSTNMIMNNSAIITITCIFERDNTSYAPYNLPTLHEVKITNNTIYFLKRRNNGSYYVSEKKTLNDISLHPSTTTHSDDLFQGVSYKTITIENLENSDNVGFFFSGYFRNSSNETQSFSFIKFDNNDGNVVYFDENGVEIEDSDKKLTESFSAAISLCFAGNRSWDITKLVVEQSVRQNLDTNFERMESEIDSIEKANVENISKYIYGTVGYNIGSNKIEGFSTEYTIGNATPLGWITKGYTYIENIVNVLRNNLEYSNDLLFSYYEFLLFLNPTFSFGVTTYLGIQKSLFYNFAFEYYNPMQQANPFTNENPFFTTFFFDLYYQPLNSFNLSYVKTNEDIDFPLEQYDGNFSGLTDFDRLSIHEQEQVDRVGNETLTISQRATNISEIQSFDNGSLYFMDDTNRSGAIDNQDKGIKYIIFKKTFSINNNCFNVSYVGSKDAVLKNYFTSIRTKYRAYQYVDYSQSTLRKEKDVLYVRIASNFFNGDDKVKWGNYSSFYDYGKIANIIYDTTNSNSNPISYECEYDLGIINITDSNNKTFKESQIQTVKNSVSLITTSNMFGIIYECMDNVGAGTYIGDITENNKVGGVIQDWQIWGEQYNEKHTVTFVNYIDFYSSSISPAGVAERIQSYTQKWEKSPIVDDTFLDLFSSNNVIFSICDSNVEGTTNYKRTFYKDASERINHTIQFIYYAPNNDILFGEDFINGIPVISRYDNDFNAILSSNNFEIDTKTHIKKENDNEIIFPKQYLVMNQHNLMSQKEKDGKIIINYEIDYSNLIQDNSTIIFLLSDASFIGNTDYISRRVYNDKIEKKMHGEVIVEDISDWDNTSLFSIPYFYNNRIINTTNGNYPVLRVYWGNDTIIKMCHKNPDDTFVDIAVFKKLDSNATYTDYFFTVNDTKTDYVLNEKNGILYRAYKVETFTDGDLTPGRTVASIYTEEDN